MTLIFCLLNKLINYRLVNLCFALLIIYSPVPLQAIFLVLMTFTITILDRGVLTDEILLAQTLDCSQLNVLDLLFGIVYPMISVACLFCRHLKNQYVHA